MKPLIKHNYRKKFMEINLRLRDHLISISFRRSITNVWLLNVKNDFWSSHTDKWAKTISTAGHCHLGREVKGIGCRFYNHFCTKINAKGPEQSKSWEISIFMPEVRHFTHSPMVRIDSSIVFFVPNLRKKASRVWNRRWSKINIENKTIYLRPKHLKSVECT